MKKLKIKYNIGSIMFAGKGLLKNLAIVLSLFIAFQISEAFSQVYEFKLVPRRAFDRLYVEIWGKSISASAPKLGYGTFVVSFDKNFLTPSADQNLAYTDTIARMESSTSSAVVPIYSLFDAKNGYKALASQSYSQGYYALEITLDKMGYLGLIPDSLGRGSFLGRLSFDIIGDPSDTVLSKIQWSKSILPGEVRVFDNNGNDLKSVSSLVDPGAFTVTGITVISPNFLNLVVDRDHSYPLLTLDYADGGYPIYFERSINPKSFLPPGNTQPAVDEDLAYVFEYSLDNGSSWAEIGRVTETDRLAQTVLGNLAYRTGEIFEPKGPNSYTITTQTGARITASTYRNPLRVIWTKNTNFVERSEQARLKISKLAGSLNSNLATRQTDKMFDINDEKFILGRLFFLQLDGVSQYLKTSENYSNSTQLTVEAWVNLNGTPVAGSEPAIVASSGGPGAAPSFGSNEGAWMLYLKNGKHPAFRVREIQARGSAPNNIYLGEVAVYVQDSLNSVTAVSPLTPAHAQNWAHIAATVKDNTLSLYLNGELVDQYVNTNANDIRMQTANQPLWIGVNPNGAIDATRYLNAGIKGVRVWRNALSQDEIRKLVGGVVDPNKITSYSDLRKGLEIYYSFEGNTDDAADNIYYQNSTNTVDFYQNGAKIANVTAFRPDRPHLKITAPAGGSGITNKKGENTEIRWAAYGLGDISKSGSKDLEIEYTTDAGETWTAAKNPNGDDLAVNTAPDVEDASIIWQPYLNNKFTANLRTLKPYAKTVKLRVRGTTANTQNSLMDVTPDFQVAPYFALKSLEGTIFRVSGSDAMNITGNNALLEAWIKPYRYPTATEGYFPIIEKFDTASGTPHYALRMLANGSLQFLVTNKSGAQKIALSDSTRPILRPNSVDHDSSWTHVAVFLTRNGATGPAEVRFFIDGIVQRDKDLSKSIGDTVDVNGTNISPLFIGFEPAAGATGLPVSFVGEINEVRLWKGVPNNYNTGGDEPTQLTRFIQAAQSVYSSELSNSFKTNLHSAYSFNGGTFVINGNNRAVAVSAGNNSLVRNYGTPIEYVPLYPFLKLVEPAFKQSIENSLTDARVRWVGAAYDGTAFQTGAPNLPPSLEYSIRGGGGKIIQPYQFVGSDYWAGNLKDAVTYPDSTLYRFKGTGSDIYYSLKLDASVADPDANKDGAFNDQGPLSASLTNARLRLTGRYNINGETDTLRSEGPLFTITPSSNFTVRVLLEGYHKGAGSGNMITNIGSTYDRGGLRIQLYQDNSNEIGPKIGGAVESKYGYADRDPVNRQLGTGKFANVNFVYTDLTNGKYWVLVDHINHLPVMSRFPAPFEFTGDIPSTWPIESGWDFTSWNGVDNNVLPNSATAPWSGAFYSAKGSAISTKSNPDYSTTGLIYNGGALGNNSPMPAMVGGDVNKDGQINSADRVLVRKNDGTSSPQCDVTGDNYVNAVDRTICDRNFGKVSSIFNETLPGKIHGFTPNMLIDQFAVVSELDPDLSKYFNENSGKRSVINIPSKLEKTLAGASYTVTAETKYDSNYVDLSMYINNTGDEFALANCTFAVNYNSSSMDFVALTGADSVIFSNRPDKGYAKLRTAPSANTQNPIPDVRTIEVDYDAFANLGGVNVPNTKTYLGTLRFYIKNKKGALGFKWHDSKAVINTLGRDVTEFGNWVNIPGVVLYNANIVTPNGGERYSQNKTQKITWTSNGDASIYVEYSTDDGIQWHKINTSPISLKLNTLDWVTPPVSSSLCKVRIMDAESGVEVDRSSTYFSILAGFAQIIRPSSGDATYIGGTTDKIKWDYQGYDNVRFEYSTDAGNTWKAATTKVGASSLETAWKLPSVTTKVAMVRMIDADAEKEIARTGLFKILNGTLIFKNPKANEALVIDRYYMVKWVSSGVQTFDLELSTDGGVTWAPEKSSVAAPALALNWKVANKKTDFAVFRALWNSDPEMEYARSEQFKIIGNQSVKDNSPAGVEFNEAYPNPARNTATVEFETPYETNVYVRIFSAAGEEVKYLGEFNFASGKNKFDADLSLLPSGKYFLHFDCSSFRITREINVVK